MRIDSLQSLDQVSRIILELKTLVVQWSLKRSLKRLFNNLLRKSKRNRTSKNFGLEFQLYLIAGTRDEVSDQHFYCFNVEDDLKIFDEAMKSQDFAFWKEAINDEMDSIMGNNTWVMVGLPLGCKPLGCKWIFKRKLKVDETIEKFKAMLVIQGFRQKSRIDYFDTYAQVARISNIRLVIAMISIHNLIIHQMDVKTAYLNCELDEEVYVNQPKGFIMPGNENNVCKLIKSLYGLKQAPKQWHQKFDEVYSECSKAEQWLHEKSHLQDSMLKHSYPILWASEINKRVEVLERWWWLLLHDLPFRDRDWDWKFGDVM
ncbi:zinc finger, CCHC-type containing protein, partial [Tanacetum coccineum]